MSQWLGLNGKTYMVTGGSSGIGAEIVDRLLEVGANVANVDINATQDEREGYLAVQGDVSDHQSVNEAVQSVIDHFGALDGVVNNAGINIPALLVDAKASDSDHELNEAIFDKMISINQKGLYLVSQAVGRLLVKQKSGVIINVSSEAGLEGSLGQSCYAATKAAAYSFTRSWAKELGQHNVRVVGIAPGILEETGLRTQAYEEALAYTRDITVDDLRKGYASTTITPLGRSGRLDEVADVVAFLLSDRSSYITGTTINIAGGKTRG